MAKPTPLTRAAYQRFITITTRWMDNDVYGHVNNVTYYSFFDTAVNQYLIEQGVLDVKLSSVVCLVVDTGCQFFSSVAFPDTVHCGLRVAHLGTSSIRYELGIFRNEDSQASAQGHFVHVACDRITQRPVAIPDDLRRALATLTLK